MDNQNATLPPPSAGKLWRSVAAAIAVAAVLLTLFVLPAEYGITHNNWLIHADGHKWKLATPDGLNDDWSLIAEVKTTGKDWGSNAIPIQYRRQVQWQMYVTGASACVFAWLLRIETADGFAPGWFEPKTIIIKRDDRMIADLIEVAERLQMEMVHHDRWTQEKEIENGTLQP